MIHASDVQGVLVAVEGISGAGKTTVSRVLKCHLEGLGWDVLLLGGFELHSYSSPLTAFCRELASSSRFIGLPWLSEVHLLIAELLHDTTVLLTPALRDGRIVVFDGYWDSLLAYQIARMALQQPDKRDDAVAYLRNAMDALSLVLSVPTPDMVIYVRCETRIAQARLEKRDQLRISNEDMELQDKIDSEYRSLFADRSILEVDNSGTSHWSDCVTRVERFLAFRDYPGAMR